MKHKCLYCYEPIEKGWSFTNVAIVFPEDTEELALTLAGKKKKLTRKRFDQLAEGKGLTARQIEGVFNRMTQNKSVAFEWIDRSFLTDEMKTAYKDVLDRRYKQLGLASPPIDRGTAPTGRDTARVEEKLQTGRKGCASIKEYCRGYCCIPFAFALLYPTRQSCSGLRLL